jgi:hypothetical protein
MSQMLVIPHRFYKIGVHNLVVRRFFSDILLVLGLKNVEKHCLRPLSYRDRPEYEYYRYTNLLGEVTMLYLIPVLKPTLLYSTETRRCTNNSRH